MSPLAVNTDGRISLGVLGITEDSLMAAIVEFPTIVQEALAQSGDLLANELKRVHFAKCLTGLFVAGRKHASAINRKFAVTTDQSCLIRCLTVVKRALP